MVARASTRVDERLLKLLPEGFSAGRIARSFYLMGIAEEEIKAAKLRFPRKRKTVHSAFQYLYPGEVLPYADALYRSHAREIIYRVARGQDVRPGTDAELLVMFSETSLRAPLASQFAHAYSAVFFRVFPDDENLRERLWAGTEAWKNGTEEIIAEARKRLVRDRGQR